MNITFSLLCLFVAIIFGAVMFSFAAKRDDKKKKSNEVISNEAKPKWRSWILPAIIATLLAFWSVVYALFFLAIVWVMRLDPKTDSKEIPFPSNKDQKRAKGTYIWLLLSPLLNVTIFVIAVINLSSRSSANERVLVALIPLVFHLPVLFRLDTNSPFVFRHTQQAIFLLALRTSMAALAINISKYPGDGIWVFLLGNGFLWLFGSFWGRGQAHRGTGWWINRKGEKVVSLDIIQHKPIKSDTLTEMLKSLNAEGSTTRQIAMNAFRKGTPEMREKAVRILSELGEVEKF